MAARGHAHLFNRVFPGDARFESCACGAVRRADRISNNPCVQWWGRGPAGRTCGDCAHLRAMTQSKTWRKCDQRHDLTHSSKTDQRVRWEACGRFVERNT